MSKIKKPINQIDKKKNKNSFLMEDSILLEFLNIKENEYIIEGVYSTFILVNKPLIAVFINGKICNESNIEQNSINIENNNGKKEYKYPFKTSITININSNIEFKVKNDDSYKTIHNIFYGKFFPLSNKYKDMYFLHKNIIVTCQENKIVFLKYSILTVIIKELKLIFELLKDKSSEEKEHKAAIKATVVRPLIRFLRIFKKKQIWLFRDRTIFADDNAFALFEYINQIPDNEAKLIFGISKECNDYKKVKRIGKVVDCLSHKYKILYLLCDYFIASGSVDPFEGYGEPYKDIRYGMKFIFLQHGVTKDDISYWLKKSNQNIYGFITSSTSEAASLADRKYGYTKKEIWLTGMPRFDKLVDQKEKIITFAPTWRQYLVGEPKNDSSYEMNKQFCFSNFYMQYSELFRCERLLRFVKSKDYKIWFFPHPVFRIYSKLFESEDILYVPNKTYLEVYMKSALFITDYSSAAFDFAYLKKPVLYFQFDKEEVYAKHVYKKGYFSYENDGFGEVEYNVNALVDRIVEYINKDCEMKEHYKKRVDDFFEYRDKNNCQRVYERILKDSKKSRFDI